MTFFEKILHGNKSKIKPADLQPEELAKTSYNKYYEESFNTFKEHNDTFKSIFNKIVFKINATLEKLNEQIDLKSKLPESFLNSLEQMKKEAEKEILALPEVLENNKNTVMENLKKKDTIQDYMDKYSNDRDLLDKIQTSVNLYMGLEQDVRKAFSKIYSGVKYGESDKGRDFDKSMMGRKGEINENINETIEFLGAVNNHKEQRDFSKGQ